MKILLHICCAPCLIYPYDVLSAKKHELIGYFFNNNIHPYNEFKKRLDTLKCFAEKVGLDVRYDESYDINEFFRNVVFNEDNRCAVCYFMRLEAAVKRAKKDGCDAFCTTLLYSKYQKHDKIVMIAEELSKEYGVPFYYEDFRTGWGKGIKESKKLGMYRQQYCGCIYSERERYIKGG